jgi:hypothetical protein
VVPGTAERDMTPVPRTYTHDRRKIVLNFPHDPSARAPPNTGVMYAHMMNAWYAETAESSENP